MSDAPPPDTARPNVGRWLVLAVAVGAVVLFVTAGPDEQSVIRRSAEWRDYARGNLTAAFAAFVAAEVALVAVSAPVGIWLTVLAGFLFGVGLGTLAVNVGSTLGAVLAFLAARYVFADAIHRAAARRPRFAATLAALDRRMANHGGYTVLLLRLTPVFPFWVLNLGLGMTRVRIRDYWSATQLGTLPATLVVANLGASLAEITSFRGLLSPRVLGALCLLPLLPIAIHYAVRRFARTGG